MQNRSGGGPRIQERRALDSAGAGSRKLGAGKAGSRKLEAGSRTREARRTLMDRINNFAFKIATANGTGSASANGLIMQAIFRMGVPVTGKNVFPSNIQGLPTWYEMRVSRQGSTARTPNFDLRVALNPATYQKDVAEVRAGGWLLYDSTSATSF